MFLGNEIKQDKKIKTNTKTKVRYKKTNIYKTVNKHSEDSSIIPRAHIYTVSLAAWQTITGKSTQLRLASKWCKNTYIYISCSTISCQHRRILIILLCQAHTLKRHKHRKPRSHLFQSTSIPFLSPLAIFFFMATASAR